MKKQILIGLTIIFLLCLLVAPAIAAETMTYEYTGSSTWANTSAEYGGSGQVITGNGEYLSTVDFKFKRNGAAFTEGSIQATLISNWTAGFNGTTVENSSNTVSCTSIGASYQWFNFTFSSTNKLQLGVDYLVAWWIVEAPNAGIDTADGADGDDHYYKVNLADDWNANAGMNLVCRIYTTSTYSGGGLLPTTPGYDWTDNTDLLVQNLMNFLVPIIVMLLPALLLMVITRSTGKWILLIGLTIGTGLGYFFSLVPLWLVFLVIIGLIGMAYQSVRGGG